MSESSGGNTGIRWCFDKREDCRRFDYVLFAQYYVDSKPHAALQTPGLSIFRRDEVVGVVPTAQETCIT